jgi:dTDP-4-dehydrorhamnose reductase
MPSAKPRLLVIGSRGFLGSYAAQAAKPDFEVIEANRSRAGQSGIVIDIRDQESVRSVFQTARPDFVLLLSAISDIDRCEQYPDEARAVNLHGAELVSEACARSNTRLLFTSTGAVFDGRKHGYTEQDPVSPVSVYGETKARAEKIVSALGPSAIIVRIALAIGFAANPDTNSLLDTLKKRWASGQTVALPIHEQRNPIDAFTATRFMLELLNKNHASGIFHLGCMDVITRYDLGLKLADRMGYTGLVRAQTEPVPGRAPRGPDHYLLTDKLRAESAISIPSCEEVIERCFDVTAQS